MNLWILAATAFVLAIVGVHHLGWRYLKKKRFLREINEHHFSGWPGAYCLKCHGQDPVEIALADGHLDDYGNPTSPGIDAEIAQASICPVKGKLVWNDIERGWDIVDAVGITKAFFRFDPARASGRVGGV